VHFLVALDEPVGERAPVTTAKYPMPTTMSVIERILASTVVGNSSPYPTVVMVVTAQ
jgi:hypothetical protein